MAAKKTPKRPKKGTAPAGVPPTAPPASSGSIGQWIFQHKGLILGLLAAYAAIFAAVNYYFLVKPEVRKNIPVTFLSRIEGKGKACGPFEAFGLAALGSDRFVFSDYKNARLLVFDLKGNFLKGWTESDPSIPKDKIGNFIDVTSDKQGNLSVVDTNSAIGWTYTPQGKVLKKINLGLLGFYVPRSLIWEGDNCLVTDTGGHRIVRASGKAEFLGQIGRHGTCKDCFTNPYMVVPDGAGNYYVADYDNLRVKYLSPDGKVLKVLKVGSRPSCLTVDATGHLYVASEEQSWVKVYGPKAGDYLGTLQDAQGNENFQSIRGMAITPEGTLILSERGAVDLIKVTSALP